MDALFERYKASFMTNRSSDPRNGHMNDSQRQLAAASQKVSAGGHQHPYNNSAVSISAA